MISYLKTALALVLVFVAPGLVFADARIETGAGTDVCHVPYEADTTFASYLAGCRAVIRRSGDAAKASLEEIYPSVQPGYLPPGLAEQSEIEGNAVRRISNADAAEPCVLVAAGISFTAPSWVAHTIVERTSTTSRYRVTYRLVCWGGQVDPP